MGHCTVALLILATSCLSSLATAGHPHPHLVNHVVGAFSPSPTASALSSLVSLGRGARQPRQLQQQQQQQQQQQHRLRGGGHTITSLKMDAGKVVQFVTNKMCPFAQKVWVCLEEKQVDYQLVEIGLYGSGGKPDWFMKLNPKGKVPVLKHGDKGVVESNSILKYIDENFGERGSLSRGGGSKVDEWFQLMDGEVLPRGKELVNGQRSSGEAFHKAIARFENGIVGPYLLGKDISLADIHAAPMMWRIMTESSLLGVTEQKYPKTHAWMRQVNGTPSFKKTVVSSWWWWW